jgi:CHAT domain-containing protein
MLAAASRTFRDRLARRSIGIDEVIAALPRGGALVAYALFEKKEVPHVGFADPPGTLSYAAFTVGPGSKGPALVPLGAAKEIDALVQTMLERIAQEAAAPGRSPKSSEAAYRDAARALRARIWDPVAPRVEGAGQIFIVPDGALHLLPFPALPTNDGGYLVERDAVLHILGTERDVAVPASAAPGSGLLAVGGPAFDATSLFAALGPGNAPAPSPGPASNPASATAELDPALVFRGARSACGAFRTLHFDPLPAAGGEVAAIASVWRSSGGIARYGGAETLTGEAASETALKRDAPGRRTLHLATHGFFLRRDCPSTPASSSPAGRDGESAALDAIENPLLLSGLALAGANHRDAAGAEEDDGVLTAEEVAALDLSGVEWAVLSACETGVGDVMAGEGVFGLQRAFQVAGARTVITSLWAVDDEATRAWMDKLYRARLVDAKSTAVAVRDASLSVLREGRDKGRGGHPYYWAGFVAVGDWR